MVFSCNPINSFQDDGLSKEDRVIIDAMRNTAYMCGNRGGDVEHAVHQTLKKMGRYDLLPPCERESEEDGMTGDVKTFYDGEYEVKAKIVNRGNCMLCGKPLTEGEGIFFCKECTGKMRYGNNKRKKELEDRFNRSVQNVIEAESEVKDGTSN